MCSRSRHVNNAYCCIVGLGNSPGSVTEHDTLLVDPPAREGAAARKTKETNSKKKTQTILSAPATASLSGQGVNCKSLRWVAARDDEVGRADLVANSAFTTDGYARGGAAASERSRPAGGGGPCRRADSAPRSSRFRSSPRMRRQGPATAPPRRSPLLLRAPACPPAPPRRLATREFCVRQSERGASGFVSLGALDDVVAVQLVAGRKHEPNSSRRRNFCFLKRKYVIFGTQSRKIIFLFGNSIRTKKKNSTWDGQTDSTQRPIAEVQDRSHEANSCIISLFCIWA